MRGESEVPTSRAKGAREMGYPARIPVHRRAAFHCRTVPHSGFAGVQDDMRKGEDVASLFRHNPNAKTSEKRACV